MPFNKKYFSSVVIDHQAIDRLCLFPGLLTGLLLMLTSTCLHAEKVLEHDYRRPYFENYRGNDSVRVYLVMVDGQGKKCWDVEFTDRATRCHIVVPTMHIDRTKVSPTAWSIHGGVQQAISVSPGSHRVELQVTQTPSRDATPIQMDGSLVEERNLSNIMRFTKPFDRGALNMILMVSDGKAISANYFVLGPSGTVPNLTSRSAILREFGISNVMAGQVISEVNRVLQMDRELYGKVTNSSCSSRSESGCVGLAPVEKTSRRRR